MTAIRGCVSQRVSVDELISSSEDSGDDGGEVEGKGREKL